MPPAELLRTEPPSGFLLLSTQYTAPNWHASLFAEGMQRDLLPKLMRAAVVRENAGVRLLQGIQVDERVLRTICTSSPARVT